MTTVSSSGKAWTRSVPSSVETVDVLSSALSRVTASMTRVGDSATGAGGGVALFHVEQGLEIPESEPESRSDSQLVLRSSGRDDDEHEVSKSTVVVGTMTSDTFLSCSTAPGDDCR